MKPVYPDARLSLTELKKKSRDARDAHLEASTLMSWRIYSYLGMPFLKGALWIGLSPNQVTLLSILCGLFGCGFLVYGGYASGIIAAAFLQAMVAMDYADGALARLTGRTSLAGLYFALIAFDIVGPLLFLSLGWGLYRAHLSEWYLLLGFATSLAYLFNRHVYNYKIIAALVGDKARMIEALTGEGTDVGQPTEPKRRGGSRWRSVVGAAVSFPWPMRNLVNLIAITAIGNKVEWLMFFCGIVYPAVVTFILLKELRSDFDWVYRWARLSQP